MLKESQAEPILLNNISGLGICQYSKCFSTKNNLLMFRKSYCELEQSKALHEISVNERIKCSLNDSENLYLVDYYDSYINSGSKRESINLLFEYSEIGSLFDNINSDVGRMITSDFFFLRKFLIQIVSALIQIHRLGIVHNDIKLENILLFNDKKDHIESNSSTIFKVGDFNNSLYVDSDDNIIDIFLPDDYHLCPFDFSFERPSFKFDFWCLGLMLLKIFYNFNPTSNFLEILQWIRKKSYRGNFTQANYFKKEFKLIENLIEKLLDFDLEERLDDQSIFSHQFFYETRNFHVEVLNPKSRRIIKVYQKKLYKLKKVIDDCEKFKKKNICINKLKKRMLKYVKVINKIKSGN